MVKLGKIKKLVEADLMSSVFKVMITYVRLVVLYCLRVAGLGRELFMVKCSTLPLTFLREFLHHEALRESEVLNRWLILTSGVVKQGMRVTLACCDCRGSVHAGAGFVSWVPWGAL